MTSMLVKFEQPEQVVDFVNTLSHYDCDADIKYGSRMVDAKSVLGVLYLAVSRTVELILHIDEDGSGDIKTDLRNLQYRNLQYKQNRIQKSSRL